MELRKYVENERGFKRLMANNDTTEEHLRAYLLEANARRTLEAMRVEPDRGSKHVRAALALAALAAWAGLTVAARRKLAGGRPDEDVESDDDDSDDLLRA